MTERILAVVDQPCVLCEETLETWTYFKDEEREGQERIERTSSDHQCSFMADLIAERARALRYR